MQRETPQGIPNVRDPVRQVNVMGDPYENDYGDVGNNEEEEYDIPKGQKYAHKGGRNGKGGPWRPYDEVN